MTSDEELISAYWQFHLLARSSERLERLASNDLLWAWDRVFQAACDGEVGIVPLLMELAEAAPDERCLCSLGAGPIENLADLHRPDLDAEIKEAIRTCPAFARTWECVWITPG